MSEKQDLLVLPLQHVTDEALRERAKELRLIYSLSELAQDPAMTVERFLPAVAAILPAGWRYPDDACAAVTLAGQVFASDNYRETPWQQRSPISVDGSAVGSEGGELTDLLQEAMQWGGFGLVSYRPSLVARPLLERLDQLLLTRLALPEEIETVASWLRGYKGSDEVLEALPTLPRGQAYLCSGLRPNGAASRPALVRFQVGGRAIPHIRHLHKYLRTPLPETRRFYFRTRQGQAAGTAASLWEFRERLAGLPADALRYHMGRGDFAAWIEGALHDEELARRVSKIADRQLHGDVLRQALLETVVERYEELEMLV